MVISYSFLKFNRHVVLFLFVLFLINVADAGSSTCTGADCNDNLKEAMNQYAAAEHYFNSKDYDKAIAAYMTASNLGYKSCESDKKVVEIYSLQGNKNIALTYSYGAFNHCGEDAELYRLQGNIFTAQGRKQEALEAYEKADKIYQYTYPTTSRTPVKTITTKPVPTYTRSVTPTRTVTPIQTSTPTRTVTPIQTSPTINPGDDSMNIIWMLVSISLVGICFVIYDSWFS